MVGYSQSSFCGSGRSVRDPSSTSSKTIMLIIYHLHDFYIHEQFMYDMLFCVNGFISVLEIFFSKVGQIAACGWRESWRL